MNPIKLSTQEVKNFSKKNEKKVFTEEQATLIKQEIQKHHNLESRQIDNVSTDLGILANATTFTADSGTLLIVEKDGIQTVSARELYKGLGITDRFNRWFESLLKYGFVAEEDFCCVKTSTQQNQYGGEKEIDDYAITLDMAKQICMLQRSEKGRQYRQYLINLEKAWNSPEKVMERALAIAHQRAEEATRRIMEMQPKAEVYDRIADGTGCFSMNQTAKALKLPYGNIKLYEKLRSMEILNADNSPKQEQINSGHFKVVVKFINDKVGSKPVTLTTAKGLVYLAKKFNTEIDESVAADF